MKSSIFALAFLGICFVVTSSFSPAGQEPVQLTPTTWEHLAMTQDDSGLGNGLGRKINELGDQGWELVCVTPILKEGTTARTRYFFKRPQ